MSWKEFANNFNSVYGAFNNTFKNMKAKEISDWEVEDELDADGVATGNKIYGGQVLPTNYTQADLDERQYRALGDVYTKFGDAAGGLKLRLDANKLRKGQSETRVQEGSEDALIEKPGIENENTKANTKLTNAKTDATEVGTDLTKEKIKGQKESNYAAMMQNELTAMRLDQDKLQNEALTTYQMNVKDGMYENDEEAYKDFIRMQKQINPEVGAAMEAKYDKQDIQKILNNSTKTAAEIQDSLINGYDGKTGIDAAIAYIDKKNGLDIGVELRNRDGGGMAIVAVDKDGNPIDVIAEGRDQNDLKSGLFYYSTPGGSVKLEEQIYSFQKTESEIKANNNKGLSNNTKFNQEIVKTVAPYASGAEDLNQKVNDAVNVYKGLNATGNTNSNTGYVDMGNGVRGKKKDEEETRYGRR